MKQIQKKIKHNNNKINLYFVLVMRCGGLASSCNGMKELNANIINQPQDQNNNYDVRGMGEKTKVGR